VILQSITNFLCLHALFEEELDDIPLLDLHGTGTFWFWRPNYRRNDLARSQNGETLTGQNAHACVEYPDIKRQQFTTSCAEIARTYRTPCITVKGRYREIAEMLFGQWNADTEYDRGETPVQKSMVISERDEITRFVSVVDGGGLTLEMVASSLSSTPCVQEDLTKQTFYLEFPLIAIFSPEGNLFHFTKHFFST
jgi:hypothetical protein